MNTSFPLWALWTLWFVLSLVLAPLLPGVINKVKAFFAGRRGPSVFQLYYDLGKLLRKEGVFSTTSGGMLRIAPCITLAMLLAAALFLPYGLQSSPCSFTGDVILFFYLLGSARMAVALAALDTGSSFEGMGASREMQFSALAEAATFGVVGFLALLCRRGDLAMLAGTGHTGALHATSVVLSSAAFFVVLLAENSRVPVDDPETHLELTMIHEAMVLDCAGPDLALILYGAALKLWLFATFFVALLLPALPWGAWASAGIFFAAVLLTGVLIGAVESSMARYRFLKVPQMLIGALGVALLGIFFLFFFEGGLK